jgi:hypothetical protein
MAKIIFKNGSSFELPDGDTPEEGRASSPYKDYGLDFATGIDHHVEGYVFNPSKIMDINPFIYPESTSMTNDIIGDLLKETYNKYSDKLEVYLKKNLLDRGFEFASQEEFYKFIKNRVQRVVFEAEQEVHYYIDFIDLENRGSQIGLTNENRVEFEFDPINMKYSATIG